MLTSQSRNLITQTRKNQYRQTSSKPDKFNPYKPSVLSTDIGVAPITQPTNVRNKNSNIQGR